MCPKDAGKMANSEDPDQTLITLFAHACFPYNWYLYGNFPFCIDETYPAYIFRSMKLVKNISELAG